MASPNICGNLLKTSANGKQLLLWGHVEDTRGNMKVTTPAVRGDPTLHSAEQTEPLLSVVQYGDSDGKEHHGICDPGLLIETPDNLPIAFVNTKDAADCLLSVYTPSGGKVAEATVADGSHMVVLSDVDGRRMAYLAAESIGGHSANIMSSTGELLATVSRVDKVKGQSQSVPTHHAYDHDSNACRVMRVGPRVDTGLVLVALVSAMRLGFREL
mmetsp:Transcript_2342/g.4939  ORF Transcript_2342/g.4939 Transcript_2342/m.4939 type:complete len:214 (-) Transcript_2342:31-672(-)